MSYERRGGGYRRRHRDDYDDRRREVHETPEQKLKTSIIKLGEVDAIEELPRLESQIREHVPVNTPILADAFHASITEQPYKIPYYAALLRLLHNYPEESAGAEGPSLGRQVLEDFWKGFQAYLDKLSWREMRLCIHFFAHLTMAKIISPESMFNLLQTFVAVLDEFGVSHGRAKKAALCAGEGLMICGPVLYSNSPQSTEDIISAIQAFGETTTGSKWLVHPVVKGHSQSASSEHSEEIISTLLNALIMLKGDGFSSVENSFPQPYAAYGDLSDDAALFDLPVVLVPPEVIELDTLSTGSEEETQVKKEEWPEYFLRLFDNEISPDPNTPAGYVVRSALLDIVNIFEVNRKECARLLLEYPKWNLPGTFKPKPGAPSEVEPVPSKDWQLESTVIETILGALFILPESPHNSIYYIGLITELCKLSPSTVGPAVGKSIRKLYNGLSEGLDVEISRRFAEWFAVHMSNFGFQWVWKEWVPDLALDVQHPRRAFIRRAIEFEIRLSYHERILKTLPEVMQTPDAFTISPQAPGADFEYDDPSRPHHDSAQSVLNLFRGRAKPDDVISHLDTLRTTLESSDEDHINVDALVRSIAVQSLLHIGSRSFSHLLNAIERYLPLLRNIANGGVSSTSSNAEAKGGILSAVAAFWKYNRQMIVIVFDKLMQYQIVDPTDVVAWTFLNKTSIVSSGEAANTANLSAYNWDLIRAALDKANGRVVIARKKVTALRKEDDDTRAREKANAHDHSMEVDADRPDETPVEDNPALSTAVKAFTSLTREQKTVLSRTLEGFVSTLAPHSTDSGDYSSQVISEKAWQNRANWSKDEWNAWEMWGWYRQFCRAYSPYLRNYSTTLYTVSFSKFEGSTEPAVELLKKIWNIAIGQET